MESIPCQGVLKSSHVIEYLLALIAKTEPHGKIPSEHELVRLCGVSRGTVGRAVGELVSRGSLYRIRGKGTFVAESAEGIAPRSGGRVLMATRVRMQRYHPFFSERFRGMADRLGEAGMSIEVMDMTGDFTSRLSAASADTDVRGMILCTLHDDCARRIRQDFGKPTVAALAGTDAPLPDLPSICIDTKPALRRAAARFCEAGHKRILLIGKEEEAFLFQQEMGAHAAIHLCGAAPSEEAGYEAMRFNWNDETGIYVSDDVVARGAIAALMEKQCCVPDDLSFAATVNAGVVLRAPKPVSAVEIDAYELGRRAADMFLRIVEDGRNAPNVLRLQATFADRGSIVPAPETARHEIDTQPV